MAASDAKVTVTDEELLSMVAKLEAIDAKEADLLRVLEIAAAYSLTSEEMAPTDPEFKAMVAQGETTGLAILRRIDKSRDQLCKQLAEHGGEKMVAALRKYDAAAAALKTRAEEFVEFMRAMAELSEEDEFVAERPVKRTRRPNAKYFGPEWSS